MCGGCVTLVGCVAGSYARGGCTPCGWLGWWKWWAYCVRALGCCGVVWCCTMLCCTVPAVGHQRGATASPCAVLLATTVLWLMYLDNLVSGVVVYLPLVAFVGEMALFTLAWCACHHGGAIAHRSTTCWCRPCEWAGKHEQLTACFATAALLRVRRGRIALVALHSC